MHCARFVLLTATVLALYITLDIDSVSAHVHLVVPENVRKMAFILHEHCVQETGVNEDWTLQMIHGSMPEDKSFGCYLHCMFDSVGLVAHDGQINFQEIMHLMPSQHQEVISDVVQRCATIRK